MELHANESWRNSRVLIEFCRDNLGYNCLNIYQTFFPVKSYLKLTITMACEAHQDEPEAQCSSRCARHFHDLHSLKSRTTKNAREIKDIFLSYLQGRRYGLRSINLLQKLDGLHDLHLGGVSFSNYKVFYFQVVTKHVHIRKYSIIGSYIVKYV